MDLVHIQDRSETRPATCGVSLGDVEGDIVGSIMPGGDVSNMQTAHGSNMALALPFNYTQFRGNRG